jgi:hypothetical protein
MIATVEKTADNHYSLTFRNSNEMVVINFSADSADEIETLADLINTAVRLNTQVTISALIEGYIEYEGE